MKFGFSYWGFCEEVDDSEVVNTPDGGRYSRPIMVKEFHKSGIQAIALQERREASPLPILTFHDGFPQIDFLFVEWRWATYKNDPDHPDFQGLSFETDLARQRELMAFYCGRIPIVVFDADLKWTNKDQSKWGHGVIRFDPCLIPRQGARSLPYWTDGKILFQPKDHDNSYLYLGANYERYWGFEKYYYEVAPGARSLGIDVKVIGNWLDQSPERLEQEGMIDRYRKAGIRFYGRNNMREGMDALSRATAVTHFGKMEYVTRGLIASRYLESLACGTPALIVSEFADHQLYGPDCMVHTPNDVVEKLHILKNMDREQRRDIVESQLDHIMKRAKVHVSQTVATILKAL